IEAEVTLLAFQPCKVHDGNFFSTGLPSCPATHQSAPKGLARRPLSREAIGMCRNIKTLFNFDPPATDEEVRAACLQFVRKLSGFSKPSKPNEQVFWQAVEETHQVARRLLDELVTSAPPKDREAEAAKAKARSAQRFART